MRGMRPHVSACHDCIMHTHCACSSNATHSKHADEVQTKGAALEPWKCQMVALRADLHGRQLICCCQLLILFFLAGSFITTLCCCCWCLRIWFSRVSRTLSLADLFPLPLPPSPHVLLSFRLGPYSAHTKLNLACLLPEETKTLEQMLKLV